jgi:hypothetical protein
MERERHLKMGTLDHIDAAALGLSLERYQKIKNDTRVQNAVVDMMDYEYGMIYSPLEQKLESLTFKLSIDDLKKNREAEMARKKKEILANVLKVEKELSRPPVKPKVTGPRSSRKNVRDADLSSFKPMSEDATELQRKQEKDQYEHYMKHRSNPAKIIDMEVTKADGLKLFDLIVKREGRAAEEYTQVSVHEFGISEHREMIQILRGKPKSALIGAWLSRIQQKMQAKVEVEERLFGKKDPSSQKRKPTEAPSGSRPAKK